MMAVVVAAEELHPLILQRIDWELHVGVFITAQ